MRLTAHTDENDRSTRKGAINPLMTMIRRSADDLIYF
jgi:hypothetical protein